MAVIERQVRCYLSNTQVIDRQVRCYLSNEEASDLYIDGMTIRDAEDAVRTYKVITR